MKRKPAGRRWIRYAAGLALIAIAAAAARQLYVRRPGYGLPFRPEFGPGTPDQWTALGGTWEVLDGAMRNDSNDRGAKLLAGSPRWRDYVVESDVRLLGTGSAGLLARVSEAELGENSFKGYFAGIREVDNSLVLGAFDFAYHEVARIRLPHPVTPARWYHLKLKVEGCRITALASSAGMPERATAPLNDPDCYRSGVIALRSNGTGGVWRNVRVSSLDSNPGSNTTSGALPAAPVEPAGTSPQAAEEMPVIPVRSLLFLSPLGSPRVSIRGSVVLTRPLLLVQDGTGGVEVQADDAPSLKIGDEVEVTGETDLERFCPALRKAYIRRLNEAVPVPPMVLTAYQIASGTYEGRFVQADGYLRALTPRPDGSIALELDAGPQSFHAIMPPGRSRWHTQGLALQSRLHVRGVSLSDSRFNTAFDPFVILVRSAEDVEVMSGPPWLRPSTLIVASLAVLGLLFTVNYLYLLAKHWRLRAVAEERERLAHEIHDTLAQSFAGIGFQLQAIRNSMPPDARLLEGQVDRAMLMTRTSHEEARRSIARLRPESLGSVGLLPALRECAERMVKNGRVTVETDGDDPRDVPLHVKDTLFRIGQEAIANSVRHADPHTIRISLHQRRASLFLSVEDDGAGFTADSDHAGFGLLGMRKRAESISATLTVRSAPGSGTQVGVRAIVGPRFPWIELVRSK